MKIKSTFTRLIFKSLYLVLFLSFFKIITTSAFLSDEEKSIGNTFATGSLDFSIRKPANLLPQDILPGQIATESAFLVKEGTLPFAYSQKITNTSGDTDLCQDLRLVVYYNRYTTPGLTLQKNIKYDGLLTDFDINNLSDMQLPNSQPYLTNGVFSENEHWYEYEVLLPNGSSPNLGNKTCNFTIQAKAWQIGGDPNTGFSDIETFDSSITTGSWAKVSGLVYNDADASGSKAAGESGLADWTVSAGKQIQTFSVSSDGTTANSDVLEDNEKYLIRVSGTFNAGGGITADAKYSVKSPSADWSDTVQGYESYGNDLMELRINNTNVNWGLYRTSHEYWLEVTGDDLALTFDINDSVLPTDNSGSLTVTIFKVENSVQTDSNGNYSLDVSDLSGEFVVAQTLKNNWTQVTPVTANYTFATPAIYENKDFGDKEIGSQEDSSRLVINEVYYDVDGTHGIEGDNEWVELYNAGANPVDLNGWQLCDNTSCLAITSVSTILPAGGFAVIARNASTWTNWTNIPSGAVKLVSAFGNGLANAGDKVILKKPDNTEVDKVSWGTNLDGLNPSVAIVAEGHSIARSPLGFDTNKATDWQDLAYPNPGTNPHSHIQISVNRENNYLIAGFTHAEGFDSVTYTVTYPHLVNGLIVNEQISGEKKKVLSEDQLILTPWYLGTCSAFEQKVCIAHNVVNPIKLSFTFKNGQEVLGTTDLEYQW